MAAFNFPNSPGTNDVHTENGISWKWNGTVWKKVASPDTIAKADSKVQVVDAGTGGYITAETDGTQRLRIQNSGAIVTGILTATSFKGDGSALTGITDNVVTINNNADNRVITGSGTANTLNAESGLIFDNSNGNLTNAGQASSYVTTKFESNYAKLDLRGNGIANSIHYILSYGAGHGDANEFHMVNKSGDDIVFRTSTSATERLRIISDGHLNQTVGADGIGFNQTAAGSHYIDDVAEANRSTAGNVIWRKTANWNGKTVAQIKTHVGADTTNKDDGYITFWTSSANNISERLRINSSGRVFVGNATNNANSNAFFKVHAADGDSDDTYVTQLINSEATAGRNYGLNIQAGSNSTDHGLRVKNRAGTVQLLVRGDGKVGINEASPDELLHITNTSGNNFYKVEASNIAGLKLVGANGTNHIISDDSLAFYTDNNPSAAAGGTYANEKLKLNGGYSGSVDVKGIPALLRLYSQRDTSDWDATDPIGKLDFYVGDDSTNNLPYNAGFIHCLNETDNANEPSGALVFGTTTANLSGGAVERMRINQSGRLMLGPDATDIQIIPHSTASGHGQIYLRGNASNESSSIKLNHFGHADYVIGVGRYSSVNGIFSITRTDAGTDGLLMNNSGRVAIGKAPETLTGKGVNAKLQVKTGSTDGYDGILIGNGYDRATLSVGSQYDLVLTSNAYPANATSHGIKFRCGSSGGGGPNERMRIHEWGGLDSHQYWSGGGNNAAAYRYFWTFGANGSYSSVTIDFGFSQYGGVNLEYMIGGYNDRRKHWTWQGYNYSGNMIGSAGAIQSGNGPQTAISNVSSYGSYGTKARLTGSSLSITHPSVRLDITSALATCEIISVTWA